MKGPSKDEAVANIFTGWAIIAWGERILRIADPVHIVE
jgi:hypothetical protein